MVIAVFERREDALGEASASRWVEDDGSKTTATGGFTADEGKRRRSFRRQSAPVPLGGLVKPAARGVEELPVVRAVGRRDDLGGLHLAVRGNGDFDGSSVFRLPGGVVVRHPSRQVLTERHRRCDDRVRGSSDRRRIASWCRRRRSGRRSRIRNGTRDSIRRWRRDRADRRSCRGFRRFRRSRGPGKVQEAEASILNSEISGSLRSSASSVTWSSCSNFRIARS